MAVLTTGGDGDFTGRSMRAQAVGSEEIPPFSIVSSWSDNCVSIRDFETRMNVMISVSNLQYVEKSSFN